MRALGADVVMEPSDSLQITEDLIRRMIARAQRHRRGTRVPGGWTS